MALQCHIQENIITGDSNVYDTHHFVQQLNLNNRQNNRLKIQQTENEYVNTIKKIILQPFYDYVRDNPDEPLPEGTFRHLLDFLVQNEDNAGRCTNNPDGLPPYPD